MTAPTANGNLDSGIDAGTPRGPRPEERRLSQGAAAFLRYQDTKKPRAAILADPHGAYALRQKGKAGPLYGNQRYFKVETRLQARGRARQMGDPRAGGLPRGRPCAARVAHRPWYRDRSRHRHRPARPRARRVPGGTRGRDARHVLLGSFPRLPQQPRQAALKGEPARVRRPDGQLHLPRPGERRYLRDHARHDAQLHRALGRAGQDQDDPARRHAPRLRRRLGDGGALPPARHRAQGQAGARGAVEHPRGRRGAAQAATTAPIWS